jgi:hypothetical protein
VLRGLELGLQLNDLLLLSLVAPAEVPEIRIQILDLVLGVGAVELGVQDLGLQLPVPLGELHDLVQQLGVAILQLLQVVLELGLLAYEHHLGVVELLGKALTLLLQPRDLSGLLLHRRVGPRPAGLGPTEGRHRTLAATASETLHLVREPTGQAGPPATIAFTHLSTSRSLG